MKPVLDEAQEKGSVAAAIVDEKEKARMTVSNDHFGVLNRLLRLNGYQTSSSVIIHNAPNL